MAKAKPRGSDATRGKRRTVATSGGSAAVPSGSAGEQVLDAVPVGVGQVVAAEHNGPQGRKCTAPLSQPAQLQSIRPSHPTSVVAHFRGT